MSNKSKRDANKNEKAGFGPAESWDFVINSGLIQLQELEAQAARLRVSIEYFEKRRASGAEFPGGKRLKDAGLV
jgi:hypothetical protein